MLYLYSGFDLHWRLPALSIPQVSGPTTKRRGAKIVFNIKKISSSLLKIFVFCRVMNMCWFWDLEKVFPGYPQFDVAENILHLGQFKC